MESTYTVTVRIGDHMLEQLDVICDAERRSRGFVIREAVQKYIADWQTPRAQQKGSEGE